MFMDRSPVDELVRVRARIAELRARESALVAGFLEGNDVGRFEGFSHDVIVERCAQTVLDPSKLPNPVVHNPAHYRTRFITSVRVVEKEGTPLHLVREGEVIELGNRHG